MFRLKLNKTFYFLTLLIGLMSFSGIPTTIKLEKMTIELVQAKGSEQQNVYDFREGWIRNLERQTLQYCLPNFITFLTDKHTLETLAYQNFKIKHIPFQLTLLILRFQHHSSFMDIESVV